MGEAGAADAQARLLFRYVTGEEWQEYRAIMAVFAGTFFSEFTPEEVVAQLDAVGTPLDAAVVSDRLESLRRWGNLTVSSATGTRSAKRVSTSPSGLDIRSISSRRSET